MLTHVPQATALKAKLFLGFLVKETSLYPMISYLLTIKV
jgi:hypothetical protein